MPWKVVDTNVFWWPEGISTVQVEKLKAPLCSSWPKLYVAGTSEDDKVVAYLQEIGQPFMLSSIRDELDFNLDATKPIFWHPRFTLFPLTGETEIREQFEFEKQRYANFTLP